jgi:hypothetical protein
LPLAPFSGVTNNFAFENAGDFAANGSTLAAFELPMVPSMVCEGIAMLVLKGMNAQPQFLLLPGTTTMAM